MTDVTKVDPPIYRVAARGGVFAHGLMQPLGAEIKFSAWPKPGLEPVNRTAKRVAAYHQKRHAWPFCPRSPWRADLQTFHLPGLLPRMAPPMQVCPISNPAGSEILGLVLDHEIDAALSAMPEYEMLFPFRIGQHHELKAGERFRFIGWPIAAMFSPVNEPARKVAAYFEQHEKNPKLERGGPWCWLRGLFLPELPSQQKAVPTKAYPGGYVVPSSQAFQDAAAAEVEALTGKRPGTPGSVPIPTPSGFSTGINRAKPYDPFQTPKQRGRQP